MTKEEILKQIEELKQQVENLPDDEKKIRTLPNENEIFTYINSSDLDYHTFDCRSMFDRYPTKENSSIGNYFKSEEDAKMAIRAMQIEQAIRIRRIELNEGWEPDWDDIDEAKYHIMFKNNIYSGDEFVNDTYGYNYLPVFGYYKSEEIVEQIVDEFNDDLLWYFTEYYPNKDKMYVWGD